MHKEIIDNLVITCIKTNIPLIFYVDNGFIAVRKIPNGTFGVIVEENHQRVVSIVNDLGYCGMAVHYHEHHVHRDIVALHNYVMDGV